MIIALLICILVVLLIGPEAFFIVIGKLLKAGFILALIFVGIVALIAISQ